MVGQLWHESDWPASQPARPKAPDSTVNYNILWSKHRKSNEASSRKIQRLSSYVFRHVNCFPKFKKISFNSLWFVIPCASFYEFYVRCPFITHLVNLWFNMWARRWYISQIAFELEGIANFASIPRALRSPRWAQMSPGDPTWAQMIPRWSWIIWAQMLQDDTRWSRTRWSQMI